MCKLYIFIITIIIPFVSPFLSLHNLPPLLLLQKAEEVTIFVFILKLNSRLGLLFHLIIHSPPPPPSPIPVLFLILLCAFQNSTCSSRDAKPPWFSGRLPENCIIFVWIAVQIAMPPWFLDWLLPLNCTHLIETSLILHQSSLKVYIEMVGISVVLVEVEEVAMMVVGVTLTPFFPFLKIMFFKFSI